MNKKLREVMEPLVEPLLMDRFPEVIERASVKLEHSIERTMQMMAHYGGGNAGPVGRPDGQERMRKIILCEKVDGAAPVEYNYVSNKWAAAVEDMLEEESKKPELSINVDEEAV